VAVPHYQLADLYGNLLKPTLEVFLLSRTLGNMMGGRNLIGFFAYFIIAAQWLRLIMPPFARYHREAQQLEGSFRSHHTRLITHAEEIAFYGGSEREREIVDESFNGIRKLNNKQYFLQLLMGMLDGYVVKYGASMVAYSMLMPAVYLGLNGMSSARWCVYFAQLLLNSAVSLSLCRSRWQICSRGHGVLLDQYAIVRIAR
jgi:ATP-binding cassette, subfamily D (ALD), member 3